MRKLRRLTRCRRPSVDSLEERSLLSQVPGAPAPPPPALIGMVGDPGQDASASAPSAGAPGDNPLNSTLAPMPGWHDLSSQNYYFAPVSSLPPSIMSGHSDFESPSPALSANENVGHDGGPTAFPPPAGTGGMHPLDVMTAPPSFAAVGVRDLNVMGAPLLVIPSDHEHPPLSGSSSEDHAAQSGPGSTVGDQTEPDGAVAVAGGPGHAAEPPAAAFSSIASGANVRIVSAHFDSVHRSFFVSTLPVLVKQGELGRGLEAVPEAFASGLASASAVSALWPGLIGTTGGESGFWAAALAEFGPNVPAESGLEAVPGVLPPRGAGLIAEVLPFDRATLEQAVDRFFAGIKELGALRNDEAPATIPPPVLLAAAVAAAELTRRTLRRGSAADARGGRREERSSAQGFPELLSSRTVKLS